MKILFYDIKDFELEYFLNNIPKNIEPYFFKHPLNHSTYVDLKYKNTESLCVFVSSKLDKNILSRFENLKFIFLRCSGYSNVDLEYCKNHDIKIFYIPSYSSASVAEYAFGLLLNLARKITVAQEKLKEGEIDQNKLTGFELNQKTIGIIGMGHIGTKIMQIAKGFDMKILIYDVKQDMNYTYSKLDELYKNSDIIMLSCPLNNQTKGLIGANALNKMKKNAFLINVARGEIVDTKALYDALIQNKISGAGLDVIECEENLCAIREDCKRNQKGEECIKKFLFVKKLNSLPNVIITPHIAYNTKEAIETLCETTLKNIRSSFEINKDTKNLVML